MFFHLAKIFWFFVQPLNLAIFLLLAGLVTALLGSRQLFAAGAVLAFLILAISSWTSAGALMLTPLEERFPRPNLPEKINGIVVLGGGFEGAVNLLRGGYEMNSGGDRFVETAVLARRFPQARVVVSGGVGALVLDGETDAATAMRLLTALGVSRDRITLESRSRDTYENVIFTRQLTVPKPGENWLLVTSAYHMPRAKALFDLVGFPVLPWPVDYRTSGREGFSLFADNPADSLETTSVAIREWIGLFAYWLTGRIDTPFPGPVR